MRKASIRILLFMTLIGGAFAYLPTVSADTLTVGPSGSGAQYTSINSALSVASPGDVVQVWAGTYQEAVVISKSVSLVSRDGPSVTIIAPTTPAAGIRVTANSVTVSGFTTQGGLMGIQLASSSSSTITNNIAVDNGIPAPHGHGFDIEGGGQNIITHNLAKNSYANGFYFYQTNNNYVYNNTVTKKNPSDTYSTQSQNAFAFSASNGNTIVGNLADSSYFTGFLFISASSSNAIVGNTAQDNRIDGLTFSDASQSNYIAENEITSNGLTGIWLNGESDFNWVTGNSIQGHGEVGIALYASSWNTLEYNQVFNNVQAGIYLWNDPGHVYSNAASPQYNTIQRNAVYENQYKGIFLEGASSTRIVGNYLHGKTGWNDDLAIYITSGNNNEVFENTLTDFQFANFYLNTPGSGNTLYHNSAFGSVSNYDNQGGTWDRGSAIGGNYWQSYSGFIGSSAQDHYQFSSENGWQQPSVSIISPAGGESWAAGAAKAVRWTARGAVYVDLYYDIGSGWMLIAGNLPNIGYYLWSLPTSTASTVTLRVDGKNSAGTVTATATTPSAFSIVSNAVSLTYPVGNDRLTASSTIALRWGFSALVVQVNLAYNCGSGWQTIVNSMMNTGSFNWAVPGATALSCYVRVQGLDSGNNQIGSDQNAVPFRIVPASSSMSVLSPSTSEILQIGSGYALRWLSSGSKYVDIYYNPGSGNVLQSTVQDTGQYYWTVPDSASSSATIGIDGKTTSGIVATDYSGVFSVVSGTPTPPSVTVNSPAAGVSWTEGSIHEITWSTTGSITNVDISYSTGGSFVSVATSVSNTGTYSWTVPNTPSTTATVRVDGKSSSGTVLATGNSGQFTITAATSPPSIAVTSPTIGVSWGAGSVQSITWAATGGTIVDVWYNPGSGWVNVVFGVANTGSYSWTVPAIASTNVRVGIDLKSAGVIVATGYSGVFTITGGSAPPSITVTSPAGGESWVAGSTHPITWTSAGVSGSTSVDIWYNAGPGWVNVVMGASNTGSYNWNVPGIAATNVRVGIDLKKSGAIVTTGYGGYFTITGGSAPPSITVTSPVSGVSWAAGSTQYITWTSNGGTSVDVWYNPGGGWVNVVMGASNTGSYSWTVPGISSTNVRIGIDLKSSGAIVATGYSGAFTITGGGAPPSIAVTSPAGGESWVAGSTHSITWTSNGGTSVDVWYNAGGGWTNIVFGAANTGSYSWTVPGIASTNVRVGIDLKSGGAIVATGYGGVFTITGGSAPPSLTVTSPVGGESWASGSTQTITWTSTGGGAYVDIYYKHDGVLTLIVRNAPNTGSYTWAVPNTPSGSVYIGMDLKDSSGKIIATIWTNTPFTIT